MLNYGVASAQYTVTTAVFSKNKMWNVVCRNLDGAWSYTSQNQQQISATNNNVVNKSMSA